MYYFKGKIMEAQDERESHTRMHMCDEIYLLECLRNEMSTYKIQKFANSRKTTKIEHHYCPLFYKEEKTTLHISSRVWCVNSWRSQLQKVQWNVSSDRNQAGISDCV